MNRPKPQNDLSLDELLLALSIAEGPSLKVSGAKLLGGGSRPLRRLHDLGLLIRNGRATTIICQECDRRHRVRVDFDPEHQAMTYFCGTAGRVVVEPEVLHEYGFQLDCLLRWLSPKLRIAVEESPIAWMHEQLWELGQANIHHRLLRIMLARRLGSLTSLAQIEAIAMRRTGKTGVILTTSTGFAGPHRLSNGFSVISLRQVLAEDRSTASIDLDRLLAIAEPEATIDPYKSGGPGPRSGAHFIKAEHRHRISKGEARVKIGEESHELEIWYSKNLRDGPPLTAGRIANIIRTEHNRYRASGSSTN